MLENEFVNALREYIDFVNQQSGMYMDACSGFSKNKVLIQRQVARVSRAHKAKIGKDGLPVIMHTSMEDPSRPDIIIQRIVRADDYILQNADGGSHEQQQARGIIIFLYTYWEDETRYRLAKFKNVDKDEIVSDIMGDLRRLRQAILHTKGILVAADHKKLKVLGDLFERDKTLFVPNESMHKIFALVKQDIARLMLEHIGPMDGAPLPGEIKEIAIQRMKIK